jgi:hypothetical protein
MCAAAAGLSHVQPTLGAPCETAWVVEIVHHYWKWRCRLGACTGGRD